MGYVAHPTEVHYREEARILSLRFSDDYEVDVPTAMLRGFCPCAHCQGHGSGPPKWNPLKTSSASRIEDVHQVGNYAICIVWGDGHDTGIYAFRYLRALKSDPDFDPESLAAGDTLDVDWKV